MLILETICALKEKFKAEYVVSVLKGVETEDIKSYGHDELEQFGTAQEEDDSFLQAIMRQAMLAGLIEKDIENYGLLKITSKGKKYLVKPTSFMVVKNNDFDEDEDETPLKGAGTSAVDPALYAMLIDLRKKMSKQLELPPFVIFQDPSIEAMATTYPVSIDELQNVPGVGAGKAKRYGEEFVALIKRHVVENEIVRPEDLRVRSVANKSKLKVSVIQSIDRKVALDDLAESKGLDFSELLDEVEAIVYSGTKINIDYFLGEIMDEDHIGMIEDYFREAETDDITDALKELGEDDFTEAEIRLVRVKFLSEMGN